MINKEQIIIDGVDVSKCPDLIKEYLPSCYCYTLDKENQEASCAGCFCLFKIKQYMNNNKLIEDLKYELACKTQELELAERLINGILKTLNLEAYDYKAYQNEILMEIRGFKKEYEELKKELRELKLKHTTLQNRYQQLDGADRYHNALENIEKIVKGMRSVFIEEISITASQLNDRIYRESTARFRQILDIINKAKGEKK